MTSLCLLAERTAQAKVTEPDRIFRQCLRRNTLALGRLYASGHGPVAGGPCHPWGRIQGRRADQLAGISHLRPRSRRRWIYRVFDRISAGPGRQSRGQVSDGRFPDQSDDVKLAVLAARYDPRCNGQVGSVGGSAGGYETAFVATTGTVGQDRIDVGVSPLRSV